MPRYPLRWTAQIVSHVVLATICLQFGAGPGRADAADANPVVIRYLNDPGFVPSFEIADALGFMKDSDIRIQAAGEWPGGPKSLAALASGSADVVGVATATDVALDWVEVPMPPGGGVTYTVRRTPVASGSPEWVCGSVSTTSCSACW